MLREGAKTAGPPNRNVENLKEEMAEAEGYWG